MFFDCGFAQACWQKVELIYNMWEVESAPAWLLDKLSTESGDHLIKIATVLWGIWWARNNRVWEGKVITPHVAVAWSSKQIQDWREAQKRKTQSSHNGRNSATLREIKWAAPIQGALKINVDASVIEGANFSPLEWSLGIIKACLFEAGP